MKKINLACGNDSLRPVISYIKVTKEFCYATDCHIAVKIPTVEILGKFNVENDFYILGKDWAKFKFYSAERFGLFDNQLSGYDKKGNRLGIIDILFEIEFNNKVGRFYDVDRIIPEETLKQAIPTIGLNCELYSRVTTALGAESCKMTFFAENKGILLKPIPQQYHDNNGIGLIMPVMVSNF